MLNSSCSQNKLLVNSDLVAWMQLEQVRLDILRQNNCLALEADKRLEPTVDSHPVSREHIISSVIKLIYSVRTCTYMGNNQDTPQAGHHQLALWDPS